MDDDLEGIVSISEEIEGECSSSWLARTSENIWLFNFDITLSVVEGNEDTMEQIDDAI
jgi:hypothetical protein